MDKEKYVDESWKEATALEKEKLSQKSPGTAQLNSDKATSEEKSSDPKTDSSAAQSNKQAEMDEQFSEETEPQGSADDNEIDFLNYVASLGFQAMIFLGQVPNPVTNEIEKNVRQAKFLIDTLSMLRDKTKGNLTKKENDLLNATVYELQMKYVELNQQGQV